MATQSATSTVIWRFATPAEVHASLLSGVSVGFSIVFVMAAVVLAGLCDSYRRLYVGPVAAVALVAFACVVWAEYFFTFDRFVALQYTSSVLELQYSGPLAKIVVLKPDVVAAVLWGSEGKTGFGPCHIKVVVKSGESYRREAIARSDAACRRLRDDIAVALRT